MKQLPISSNSFEIPLYLAPSGWFQHIPFAFELMSRLRPKLFVELGVHYGVSYFAFCQAARFHNIPCSCYGVDSWTGDEHAGFYGDEVFNKVDQHNREQYQGFSYLLKSDFDNSLSRFADKSIDLLHIDGFHTYEAVKKDFESWLPKMSDSSVVLFHDITLRERDFGVFQLWEELSALYPSFAFIHGYGLGVLATGKNIRKELLPFFQYVEADLQTTRSCYERLGYSIQEKFELQQSLTRLGQLTEETKEQKEMLSELAGLKELNDTRTTLLSQKQVRIDTLKEEILRMAQEMFQAKVQLSDAQRENQQLAHTVENARLEQETHKLEQEARKLEQETRKLEQEAYKREQEARKREQETYHFEKEASKLEIAKLREEQQKDFDQKIALLEERLLEYRASFLGKINRIFVRDK